MKRRKTVIYRAGKQYPVYPYQFNESNRLIFNVFEEIADKHSYMHSFVVHDDSKKNGKIRLLGSQIDGADFSIGGMEFDFGFFEKEDATDIIGMKIHNAVCHAMLTKITVQ